MNICPRQHRYWDGHRAAGGVHARYAAFIHPQGEFAFAVSVAILLMPILGGVGTLWGPVVGAVIYGVVQEEVVAAFPQLHLLLYGALLIVVMLCQPLWLTLYSYSFATILAGTILFVVVTKFPR